jgi:hypothetical protein
LGRISRSKIRLLLVPIAFAAVTKSLPATERAAARPTRVNRGQIKIAVIKHRVKRPRDSSIVETNSRPTRAGHDSITSTTDIATLSTDPLRKPAIEPSTHPMKTPMLTPEIAKMSETLAP